MIKITDRLFHRATTTGVIVLLFCAVFSFCGVCNADDNTLAKLSLGDAIAMALDGNASLKQSEESHKASLSRLRTAGFQTSFSMGTTASLDHIAGAADTSSLLFGNLTYKNLLGTQLQMDLCPFGAGTKRGNAVVSLRHPLMKGRGLLSDKADLMEGARSDATIMDKQLYLKRQATVQGVIEAYYNALLAREQAKSQEEAVTRAEKLAEDTRKKEEAGLVAGIEVSRADIRVAQTRDALNVQRQQANSAIDRLMNAIGSGVGQTPELTDAMPEPVDKTPELADAVKIALENRSELGVYDEQMSNQARKLAIASDHLRPGFDFVANLDSTNPNDGVLSRSAFKLGSFVTGVEYTVPIDRRIAIEDRDTTSRGLDVLKNLRAYEMEGIAEQVRSAYRAVETSRNSLDIFSQNLAIAQQNLHFAELMVTEGESDNRNVLDAQDALTQVEVGILSAKTQLHLAHIDLLYAMGEDLTTIGSK